MPPLLSYLLQGLWLLACAAPGALLASLVASALGLSGVMAALLIIVLSMVLAVLVFMLTVIVGRALRFIR